MLIPCFLNCSFLRRAAAVAASVTVWCRCPNCCCRRRGWTAWSCPACAATLRASAGTPPCQRALATGLELRKIGGTNWQPKASLSSQSRLTQLSIPFVRVLLRMMPPCSDIYHILSSYVFERNSARKETCNPFEEWDRFGQKSWVKKMHNILTRYKDVLWNEIEVTVPTDTAFKFTFLLPPNNFV